MIAQVSHDRRVFTRLKRRIDTGIERAIARRRRRLLHQQLDASENGDQRSATSVSRRDEPERADR